MWAVVTKGDGFTDNASVNAIPLPDGSVLACSESLPSLYRVRPSDLVTLEQVQLQDDGVDGQVGALSRWLSPSL
ncbi:carotenoid cleavage dioxygenase, partial [Haematococcus lacustris]